MKAIILTYAPVSDYEQEILKRTKIFKLALNQHAAYLNPNARIITDYVLPQICQNFSEHIISVRERFRCYSSRIEYPDIEFKGSTIIAAVDYLISKQYNEILIVGNNKVNSKNFRDKVNIEMNKLISKAGIYQYTNGNFNLEIKSIIEFVDKLTD